MSDATNAFGLSRHIPEAVKREVRRRSKQGCVICRALICDYEHIAPAFAAAQAHDPEQICLLCPAHHAEKTRGRLSAEQIMAAYLNVHKKDVELPFHQALLQGSLTLWLGNSMFEYVPAGSNVIEYDGAGLLRLEYKEDSIFGGSYPSLTGTLADSNGDAVLSLEDNEIRLLSAKVDVISVGPTITVRLDGVVVLQITLIPPNGFRMDRLVMKHGEVFFELDQTFGVTAPLPDGRLFTWLLPEIETKGATSAIAYTSDRSRWHGDQIGMAGDVGITLPLSGVTLAQGAGSMQIKRMLGEFPPDTRPSQSRG